MLFFNCAKVISRKYTESNQITLNHMYVDILGSFRAKYEKPASSSKNQLLICKAE